jgi:ADP-heptose:LPS heptosyltransferase
MEDQNNLPPLTESSRITVAVVNADEDATKIAREQASNYVRENQHLRVENRYNPASWAKGIFRKVKFTLGEKYYKYNKAEEVESAQLARGQHFLDLDIVSGAVREVTGAREKSQAQLSATAERFALAHEGKVKLQSTEEEQSHSNSEINRQISDIITQFSRGDIDTAGFHNLSKDVVTAIKNDPAAADYIQEASFLGTNIYEVALKVKSSYEQGLLGLDNLDQKIDLQLGKASMAANTEVDYSAIEKLMNLTKSGRYRGWALNPLVVGVAAEVGFIGLKSLVGMGARAGSGVPIVGSLVGGVFAGARRWTDLKSDRQMHEREATYGSAWRDPKRTKLEDYRINRGESGGRVSAKGLKADLQRLGGQDLSIESNRRDLMRKIAEVNARLGYGDINKVDLLSFSDRYSTEVEKKDLVVDQYLAKHKIEQSLVAQGLSRDDINRELEEIINFEADFNSQFDRTEEEQTKRFNRYRLGQALKAGAVGGILGAAGGLVGQEFAVQIGRNVLHANIGNTFLENALEAVQGKRPVNPFEWNGVGTASLDRLKELYQHPGNLQLSSDLTLRTNVDGTATLIDGSGRLVDTPQLRISADGHVGVAGDPDSLPKGVRDLFQKNGWLDNGSTKNSELSLREGMRVLAQTGRHETFTHGNLIIDVDPSRGSVSMLDYATGSQIHGDLLTDGNISFDPDLDANKGVDFRVFETRWQNEGWGLEKVEVQSPPKEVVTPQPDKEETVRILDHFREQGLVEQARRGLWHDNDTFPHFPDGTPAPPDATGNILGVEGKEVQFYHSVKNIPELGQTIQLDFSKMVSRLIPGTMRGVNWDMSIDPIHGRVHPQIINLPNGVRGFLDFELLVTPDPESDNLREVVRLGMDQFPELRNGLANIKPDSELAKIFFNLDDEGRPIYNKWGNFQKARFIEVAAIIRDSQGNLLERDILSTSVGPGVEDMTHKVPQPPIITSEEQPPHTGYKLTPPNGVDFTPAMQEIPPIPFVPEWRRPLGPLIPRGYPESVFPAGERLIDRIGRFEPDSKQRIPLATEAERRRCLEEARDAFNNADRVYFIAGGGQTEGTAGALGDAVVSTGYIEAVSEALSQAGKDTPVTIVIPQQYKTLYQGLTGPNVEIVTFNPGFSGFHTAESLIKRNSNRRPLILDFETYHTSTDGPSIQSHDESGKQVTALNNMLRFGIERYDWKTDGERRFGHYIEDLFLLNKDSLSPDQARMLVYLPENMPGLYKNHSIPPRDISKSEYYQQLLTDKKIDDSKPQIAVVLEGSETHKRYGLDNWAKVIDIMSQKYPGYQFNLIFDPREKINHDQYTPSQIENALSNAGVRDKCNIISGSLLDIAVLLDHQDLVLSNDTGLGHIAAALENGPEVVTIFSPNGAPPDMWTMSPTQHEVYIGTEDGDRDQHEERLKKINRINPQQVADVALNLI